MKRLIFLLVILALSVSALTSCESLTDLYNEIFGRTVPPSPLPCEKHTVGEWETVKEPTCTEDGLKRLICTECGNQIRTEHISAEHDIGEWTTAIAPSCSESGSSYLECRVCHTILDERSDPPSHSYVDGRCERCGKVRASEGLELTLEADYGYYVVMGIGECTDTDLVIPTEYNGLPVGSIATNAFSDNTDITSVVIRGEGVFAEAYSFDGCTSLKSVKLLGSVTVGPMAFDGCSSLSELTVSDGSRLGSAAFRGCSDDLRAYFESTDCWYTTPIGWKGGTLQAQDFIANPEKIGKYLLTTENYLYRKS